MPRSSRSKRLLALLDDVPDVDMDLKVMLSVSIEGVDQRRVRLRPWVVIVGLPVNEGGSLRLQRMSQRSDEGRLVCRCWTDLWVVCSLWALL